MISESRTFILSGAQGLCFSRGAATECSPARRSPWRPECRESHKKNTQVPEGRPRFCTSNRTKSRRLLCALGLLLLNATLTLAQNRPAAPPPGPPPTPKAAATVDLTGTWVSVINDEWRWRMITPAKGDVSFVPVNAEARRLTNAWDPAKDEADGNACRAFGAAGIMHLPTRLKISWADDNTLEIDTDAGTQKRLFYFPGPVDAGQTVDATWQGTSIANWEKQAQGTGFGFPPRGPQAPNAGSLKVFTTHMKPGYLRKNGVPYSAYATLTEFFDRIELDGTPYIVVTGIVEDPTYLTGRFITTEQFKQEPDATKWNPTPCRVPPPLAPFHPNGL